MSVIIVPGATPGLIDFWERPGSPEESFSGGTARVRRTFDCDWKNRWTFLQGLLGWSEIRPDGINGYYLHRQVPNPYEDAGRTVYNPVDAAFQSEFWLYPTTVDSVTGIAARGAPDIFDSIYANYQYARTSIVYESLTYYPIDDKTAENNGWLDYNLNPSDVQCTIPAGATVISGALQQATWVDAPCTPRRYITRHFQPTAEYLSLPFGHLYWSDDGKPAANGANKIISTMEAIYTWHQVPSSLNNVSSQVASLYNRVGTVNLYTFDNCPPGTLLLTGIESKPYRLIGGGYVADIMFKMKYFNALDPSGKPTGHGHNYFLKFFPGFLNNASFPGTVQFMPTYDYVLLTTDGKNNYPPIAPARTVYDQSDFAQLFTVTSPVV